MTDEVYTGVGGKRILDRLSLDGRIALVTGAGQGIGRGFAHALGEAGASIAVVDLDGRRADAVVGELETKGVEAQAIQGDVTRETDIERVVASTLNRFGGLDIGINNVGVNRNSPAEGTPINEWDEVLALNLRSVFSCCKAQGRVMLEVGYGKIVNTASTASLIVPQPQKQAAYNASKAGVVQLTRTLAAEWGSRGVRVNCISPGIVRTGLIEGSQALRPLVSTWLEHIPLERLAEVTDLQASVVYLASGASDYMTGHNLIIDGGQTLW